MKLTLFLLAATSVAACGSDATGLTLEIRADAAFEIDRYQIKLGDRVGLAEVSPTVEVVTADDMDGETLELEVWGLAGTVQRAYGAVDVTIVAHELRTYVIDLEGVNCTDSCEPGALRCMGDGVSTCQPLGDGCFAWGAATACPSGTPFCSNGTCGDTCVDECSAGQNACAGSMADKTCGNYDSDECLEWSTTVACGAGETCNGDQCATQGCDVTGCSAPPSTACISDSQVRAYEEGSCEATGSCSYVETTHTCDNVGCTGGKCACDCSRATECCEKVAMQNGTDPNTCQTWSISCALERPGDNTTAQARAMVAMHCPEFTCWRD